MRTRELFRLTVSLSAVAVIGCESEQPLQPAFESSGGVHAALVPSDPRVVRVMVGLNNPRGITFAPNGALYVAEAGLGTSTAGCFGSAPPAACICTTAREFTAQRVCYGPTGSVSRLRQGVQGRIVTG